MVLAGVPEFFPKLPEVIIRGVQKLWSKVLPPIPSLGVPVLRIKEALAKGRAPRAAVLPSPAKTGARRYEAPAMETEVHEEPIW